MATIWAYDGAGNLSAQIDSIPGQQYSMAVDSLAFPFDTQTAVGSTLTLSVATADSGLSSGDTFDVYVKKGDENAASGDEVAATVFQVGQTAQHGTDTIWDYDGAETITAKFLSTPGKNYQVVVYDIVNGGWGGPNTLGDGTDQTFGVSTPLTPTGDFFYALVVDNDTGFGIMNRLFVGGVASAGTAGNPPATPPPAAPILISEPPWRFVMADVIFNGSSPPGFSTLTFLDHRATSRQLRYFLRKAPEASGQVAADDPEVNIVQGGEPYVEEGVRILIGLRREGGTPPWKPRFAGPILQATRSVQGDAPFVDFTAYGPRQLLYLRPVRKGDGLLLGTKGLTFKQQKGSDILLALLNRTETADGPTFIDFTTGTLEDTDPIDINFQQGSSVGEALDQLEATGTIDVLLPTVYDPVGSPGILAQLNIYVQAGSIKRAAIMAWDLPGRNLDEINWLEDGAQRANNVELYTSDGRPTPIVFDAASIAKYGSYWGQQNYPVQTQLSAIEAEAAVQLLINRGHPETLTLGPSPQRAPIVFNEWWLADWLPTYASARLGKKLNGLYRVYDFTLNLEDDSTETVRDLLISANKQPA